MGLKSNFPVLLTPHLMLREIEFTDSYALNEIFKDEETMKWYGMMPVENMEATIRLIENLRMNYYDNRGIRWAIEHRATGAFLGTCGFHNWNLMSRRAEIGYEISKEYWGQGYCTEALREMRTFGLDAMNLHRVEALIYPENIGSQRVLEKLDFRREGLLEGYAYFRNTYQDLVMYGWINPNHVRRE